MESSNIKASEGIISSRLRFLIEVFIIFFGITIFLLVPNLLLLFILDETSLFFGPIYYVLRAVAILIAIPLFLCVSNLFITPKKLEVIEEKKIHPTLEYLQLYSLPKRDFKDQFLYGMLILFIIFIPLDFLVYFLLPQMLEYSGRALASSPLNRYLLESYYVFLFSVIIIQICVSIYEESVSRGFSKLSILLQNPV